MHHSAISSIPVGLLRCEKIWRPPKAPCKAWKLLITRVSLWCYCGKGACWAQHLYGLHTGRILACSVLTTRVWQNATLLLRINFCKHWCWDRHSTSNQLLQEGVARGTAELPSDLQALKHSARKGYETTRQSCLLQSQDTLLSYDSSCR